MPASLGAVMRKSIQDEFTHLRISRQRKYQLRMQRDQRCTECGESAVRRPMSETPDQGFANAAQKPRTQTCYYGAQLQALNWPPNQDAATVKALAFAEP